MTRKTKVRIVGEPNLASHIALTLASHYEFEKAPERYQRAVGRDDSHTDAPGCTIYCVVKKVKDTLTVEGILQIIKEHIGSKNPSYPDDSNTLKHFEALAQKLKEAIP